MPRVGVVTAMRAEARAAASLAAAGADLACAGIGDGPAAKAARELLSGNVRALMAFGLAGGLDPVLRAGAVIVPAEVMDESRTVHAAHAAWRERIVAAIEREIPVSSGALVSVSAPVASPAEKARLRRETGAAGVDMECFAVARVAADAGVPFIALRAVVDSAEVGLPASVLAGLREDGRIGVMGVLADVVCRPREAPGLMRLALANHAALAALRRTVSLGGPDLLRL